MSPVPVQVSISHRLVPTRQVRTQAGSTGNVSSTKFPLKSSKSSSTKFQRSISSSASSEDYMGENTSSASSEDHTGENTTDNLSAATSDDHNGEPHSSSSPTNSDSKDSTFHPSFGKIHANFTDLPAAPSQSTFSSGENISISSHQRDLGSHDIELTIPTAMPR